MIDLLNFREKSVEQLHHLNVEIKGDAPSAAELEKRRVGRAGAA